MLSEISSAQTEFIINHGIRVASFVRKLRDLLEFKGGDFEKTKKAAIYHDFGKLIWPVELFYKPGKLLTREDWKTIYAHPEDSIFILKQKNGSFSSGSPSVLDIIFLHHEKPDGSGYYRIKDIPVEVAFLSICDVFDACIEDRPYRRGMPANVAVKAATACWKDFLGKEIISEIKERFKNGRG